MGGFFVGFFLAEFTQKKPSGCLGYVVPRPVNPAALVFRYTVLVSTNPGREDRSRQNGQPEQKRSRDHIVTITY